jgi:hypothetical protein
MTRIFFICLIYKSKSSALFFALVFFLSALSRSAFLCHRLRLVAYYPLKFQHLRQSGHTPMIDPVTNIDPLSLIFRFCQQTNA